MPFDNRQIGLFAGLFIVLVALLAALWFFVLRTEYVPAYQNIRETDASQIVNELDNAGIAYRLENDGHDILVPKSQAAEARVAVAGANIAMGGTTGFELFNENDLGLTEFAQKINLQRAIQGELARTIMMMDGVEFARVHLAIPERTLFRSEQEPPTAAVTVEMQPGAALNAPRVAGIRQLVASSVPGLALNDVAVLNDNGGLVSEALPISQGAITQPVTERTAVENLLTIRSREAIAKTLPQQPFEVSISAFERIVDETAPDEETDNEAQAGAATRPMGLDNRSMRVLVRTPQELGPEERNAITNALVAAVELSVDQGDVLDFSTGALAPTDSRIPSTIPAAQVPPVPQADDEPMWDGQSQENTAWDWIASWLSSTWVLIPLALLAVIILAMRPRQGLSNEETESFAELLGGVSQDLEAR